MKTVLNVNAVMNVNNMFRKIIEFCENECIEVLYLDIIENNRVVSTHSDYLIHLAREDVKGYKICLAVLDNHLIIKAPVIESNDLCYDKELFSKLIAFCVE
jgi:hypothetical protein